MVYAKYAIPPETSLVCNLIRAYSKLQVVARENLMWKSFGKWKQDYVCGVTGLAGNESG